MLKPLPSGREPDHGESADQLVHPQQEELRVLVVDDERAIRNFVRTSLVANGHVALVTHAGRVLTHQ